MSGAPPPDSASPPGRAAHWHFVGAGRAARALASVLHASGADVTLWTRSAERLATLPSVLAARTSTDRSLVLPPAADVVVLAVPDDALTRIVHALVASDATTPRTWLHLSGVNPVTVLRGLPGSLGSVHPLQTLAGHDDDIEALRGAVFAIAGDESAQEAGRQLCLAAAGVPVVVDDSARPAYHLAAVLAGNGVFALLQAARTIAERAGLPADVLVSGWAHLARQSAVNAGQTSVAQAATGPVVRGDANTVRLHREWMRHHAAELDPLYQNLSRLLLEVADERGLSLARHGAVSVAVEE